MRMSPVVAARCLLHPHRESVARCPECRQAFCRECITEHAGRVICAACLRKLTPPLVRTPRRVGWLIRPLQLGSGLVVGWLCFYLLGRLLLQIPSEWHEGTKAIRILTE